jgi:hypothetical protein
VLIYFLIIFLKEDGIFLLKTVTLLEVFPSSPQLISWSPPRKANSCAAGRYPRTPPPQFRMIPKDVRKRLPVNSMMNPLHAPPYMFMSRLFHTPVYVLVFKAGSYPQIVREKLAYACHFLYAHFMSRVSLLKFIAQMVLYNNLRF